MIHTRTKHHEELSLLPQIAGACYVAASVAVGVAVAWIKGGQPKDKPEEKENVDTH